MRRASSKISAFDLGMFGAGGVLDGADVGRLLRPSVIFSTAW